MKQPSSSKADILRSFREQKAAAVRPVRKMGKKKAKKTKGK